MKLKEEIEVFLQSGTELLIPQLSIDCVIFSFHEAKLKVLLLKLHKYDLLTLPSGFVSQEEDVDTAALRSLKERTGLDQIFLQQFHTFGNAARFYPDQFQAIFSALDIDPQKAQWLFQRFVSIGYYALVNHAQVVLTPNFLTEEYVWGDVQDLPPLHMDHALIIQKALKTLQKDIQTKPVGLKLMPPSFTIPELQQLYEIILERKIDRRNFRKKLTQSKILISLDKQKVVKGHRSPGLFEFDKEKYEQSLSEKVKLGF